MAELGAGVVGAFATVGAAALDSALSFTARHDHSYDMQIDQTRRLMDIFDQAYRTYLVAEERYEAYALKKTDAQEKAREYFDSIDEFRNIGYFRLYSKLKNKRKVRKGKRGLRRVIRDTRNHYESLTTNSYNSDNSSITAASGTPPDSALSDYKVFDWLETEGNPKALSVRWEEEYKAISTKSITL